MIWIIKLVLIAYFCAQLISAALLVPVSPLARDNTTRATYKHTSVLRGLVPEVRLGALIPVHATSSEGGSCDNTLMQEGVLDVHALHFSLDLINSDLVDCCGFAISAITLDTCWSVRVGLHKGLQFILSHLTPNATSAGEGVSGAIDVVGIIGASSSQVTEQLANLFSLMQLPQISFASTSPALSNPNRYPYFLRTAPSDMHLGAALVDLLAEFEWTYVIAVFEDSPYGTAAYNSFRKETKLDSNKICMGEGWQLPTLSSTQTVQELAEKKLTAFHTKRPTAKVMILFVRSELAHTIFRAAINISLDQHFTWIMTELFGSKILDEDVRPALVGSLFVGIVNKPWEAFYEHVINNSRRDNPWFTELYNGLTNNGSVSLDSVLHHWEFGYTHYTQVYLQVYMAVTAYAEALKAIHYEHCGTRQQLCPAMRAVLDDYESSELIEQLKQITYRDFQKAADTDGKGLQFENGQDGQPIFSVMHCDMANNQSNTIEWTEVAKIHVRDSNVSWLHSKKNINTAKRTASMSSCGKICESNEIRRYHVVDTCCWSCELCVYPTIRVNLTHCQSCDNRTNAIGLMPPFKRPDTRRESCEEFPATTIGINDPFLLLVSIVSLLGLLGTVVSAVLFASYSATPIMKAASRELMMILLLGIGLCYLTVFLLVLPPHVVSCALVRMLYGTGYTVCYAAIFVKTNRIVRIFHLTDKGDPKVRRVKMVSPLSQVAIAFMIIAFQLTINLVWLMLRPPTPDYRRTVDYELHTTDVYYFCEAFEDYDMVLALVFPFILLVLTSFYAFKARKIPGQFNETRYILVTTCSTLIVWTAFVPMFFATQDIPIRLFSLSAALAVNATVTLLCMFAPKLYIVLFRPHKNTRETVMGKRGAHNNLHIDNQPSLNSQPQNRPTNSRSSHGLAEDAICTLLPADPNNEAKHSSSNAPSYDLSDSEVLARNMELEMDEIRQDRSTQTQIVIIRDYDEDNIAL